MEPQHDETRTREITDEAANKDNWKYTRENVSLGV